MQYVHTYTCTRMLLLWLLVNTAAWQSAFVLFVSGYASQYTVSVIKVCSWACMRTCFCFDMCYIYKYTASCLSNVDHVCIFFKKRQTKVTRTLSISHTYINIHTHTHADLMTTSTGINITEVQRGYITNGTVTVTLDKSGGSSSTSTDIDMWADSASVQGLLNDAFRALLPQGVAVSVSRSSTMQTTAFRAWRITFLDYAGQQPLVRVNATGLRNTGQVSVGRVTPGSAEPQGYWKLGLGEGQTAPIALNATESAVKQALETAFPELEQLSVVAVADAPGAFSSKTYPWQWMARFSRPGVVALGPQRCVHPLYVDWDPDACPATAADLFLSFYYWYWPESLQRPADLASTQRQEQLLAKCSVEAVKNMLQPATCHALVPLETLPMCDVGSGINPPCWVERFSRAKVLLRDGTAAIFFRNDKRTPTDTLKGYRFWQRAGLSDLQRSRDLTVNFTIPQSGSGMEIRLIRTRAAQVLQTRDVNVTSDTELQMVTPGLMGHASNFEQMIFEEQALFTPAAFWSLSQLTSSPDAFAASASNTTGVLSDEEDPAAEFSNFSYITLPFKSSLNPSTQFTVELWVSLSEHPVQGTFVPLVRSLGSDLASGYALVVNEQASWEFMLGVGRSWPRVDTYGGALMLEGGAFSTCNSTTAVTLAEWVHIAGVYDGYEQHLYVNGAKVCTVALPKYKFRPNLDGNIIFGGGCQGSPTECPKLCGSACAQSPQDGARVGSSMVGAMDKFMLYRRVLSLSSVEVHAGIRNESVHASVSVVVGGTQSACSTASACNVLYTSSETAAITSVVPTSGYTSSTVTIRGVNFDQGMTVSIGNRPCSLIDTPSSTQAICTLQNGLPLLGKALVSLFVPSRGYAANQPLFTLATYLKSVSPANVSRVGGTTISILGMRRHSTLLLSSYLFTVACLIYGN